jgi:hypothetical protein
MKSLSGQIRQSIALIITIGIVLLAFCLYFFVYVKNKEAHVNERNFRVLNRTAQNFSTKGEEYISKRMAKNIIVGSIRQFASGKNSDSLACRNKQNAMDCFARILERTTKEISIDTLSLSPSSGFEEFSSNEYMFEEQGVWKIRFSDTFEDKFASGGVARLSDNEVLSSADRSTPQLIPIRIYTAASVSIGDFINPLLRTDLFDDYIILEQKGRLNTVIYSTNQIGVSDSASNMIVKNQNRVASVELNGVTYLAFNYPVSFLGRKWLLAGLQKKADYAAETRSLDRPLLYTLVLILLLLLLALPMIKIIFISKNEKLNRTDVIFCALSLFLGCFFCTFIIINLDTDHLYDHNELEDLAIKIESNFEIEIEQAYNTVLGADYVMQRYGADRVMRKDFANEICMCPVPRVCPPKTDTSGVNLHWTDGSGKQRFKWTNAKLTDKIDVTDRGYFRNFKEKKAWRYPFDPGRPEYVLESILSWTELEKKAVVSRLSGVDGIKVVGITKKLRSVIEPILPYGFKFCLTDQSGNVWFHSDVRRNLNENIFDELQVHGQTPHIFFQSGFSGTCTYENRQHSLKVGAMKNFPLYLIVMKDMTFDQQSQAYAQEIAFAMIGLEVFVVLLTILLIRLIHRQAVKRLCLDWLKPDVSKSERYLRIALICFTIGILFIALVFIDGVFSELEQIHFLLTIPLCTLPLFFTYLNIPNYHNYYNQPTRGVITIIAVVMLILDVFFSFTVQVPWITIVGQVLILFLGQYFFRRKITRWFFIPKTSLTNEANVLYFYTPALALILVLIAILPTVVFYRQAANYGRMIHTMVVQSEFAKQFYKPDGARKESVQEQYLIDMSTSDTADGSFRPLEEDFYFTRFSVFASAMTTKQPLRLLTHDVPDSTEYQMYIGNQKWLWKISNNNSLHFGPEIPDPYKQTYGVTSTLSRFDLYSWRIWAFAVAAVLYLLFLIHLLCSRIYIFKANANIIAADEDLLRREIVPIRLSSKLEVKAVSGSALTDDEDTTSKKEIVAGLDHTVLNHLFIIGLPFAGKQVYLNQLVPPGHSIRHRIDVADDLTDDKIKEIEKETKDYSLTIVDHFEYDLENFDTNLRKLKLLEALFRFKDKKVVVLSTAHPIKIFESCPDMEAKTSARWHTVLAHFYKIICPLITTSNIDYNKSERDTIDKVKYLNPTVAAFIEAECNHGLYLLNLKLTLYRLVEDNNNITIQELIIKLRSLAYNYYVSLWNCCSLEEQHLIYDLAEDGVVNGRNVEAITRLVYKGIFIRENSLSLMNASFRDFVLSYINPNDALILREKVSRNGNWSKMRLSLFFVLAIVAFFLLYSQKGLSNQIMGFITALAAALPLVFKILEAISTSAAKKE